MRGITISHAGTIRKFPKLFVFLSYRKNFVGTKNEFKLAMVNEPSVSELLRFDCTTFSLNIGDILSSYHTFKIKKKIHLPPVNVSHYC